MSVAFPSPDFFRALQEAMERQPDCTETLPPCEAYCGLAVDHQLFVLEFDGRQCAAVVGGGNELDLDFVIAGPEAVWRRAIGAEDPASLEDLVEQGALEVRPSDEDARAAAREALPFLAIFVGLARGLEVKFATD